MRSLATNPPLSFFPFLRPPNLLLSSLFATRSSLVHNEVTSTTQVNLHAPCGLVEISVPTLLENGKIRYDASRRVSFMSVPSFAAAIDLDVEVGESFGWPELGDRKSIKLDVAYGGAFCKSSFPFLFVSEQ